MFHALLSTRLAAALLLAASTLVAQVAAGSQMLRKLDDGAETAIEKRPAATVEAESVLSPDLREKIAAAPQSSLRVLVYLRDQPHGEILLRQRNAASLRIAMLQGDLGRQVRMGGSNAAAIRDARRRLDEATIAMRQSARREIEQSIGARQEQVERAARILGAAHLRRHTVVNAISMQVPAAMLLSLDGHPDIIAIREERILHVNAQIAADAELDPSTAIMGMQPFWAEGVTGAGEAVAIIDTGIRSTHPSFAGKQVYAVPALASISTHPCFADNASSGEDQLGHGTHVAGIIAGLPGPGPWDRWTGLGIAPGIDTIYAIKAGARLSGIGGCPDNALADADILAGLEWALFATPATVVNMSFGSDERTEDNIMARIFDFLSDALGVTFVVAAGNNGLAGTRTVGTTAVSYNGITVANWDARGTLSKADDAVHYSSSQGPTLLGRYKPDVAAPGTNIYSASHEHDGWARMTGTSMAAPKVTGAVALLAAVGIREPIAQKAVLINTTDHVGWKVNRGWGLVNISNLFSFGFHTSASVTDASGSAPFRLFRVSSSGDYFATLAWNRHFDGATPVFHDLDLQAYSAASHSILVQSVSSSQNVEQISFRLTGDAVLKVSAADAAFSGGLVEEPFVLAHSEAALREIAGPSLAVACQAPASAKAASTVTITCAVVNNGDTDARQITIEGHFDGGPAGTRYPLSNLATGQSATKSFSASGLSAGRYRLIFTTSGAAFGETWRAATEVILQII